MVTVIEYRAQQMWERIRLHESTICENKKTMNVFDYLGLLRTMEKAGILAEWIRNEPGHFLEPTPKQIKSGKSFLKKYKRILWRMDEDDCKRIYRIPNERREYLARKSRVSLEEVHLLLDRFEDIRLYARIYRSVN